MASRFSTISDSIDFSSIFSRIGSAKTVGLQLPDGLKYYAGEIARRFRERGYEVFISGKPSYGACDIDVALLEIVEVLIHFGHTKMVNLDRVVYVPYNVNYDIDVELLKEKIPERRIAIIGTASYAWKFEDVARELTSAGFDVELERGRGVELRGQVLGCNYSCLRNTSADAVVFIGDGTFHAMGASIYCGKKVYAYSPLSGEVREIDTSEFLKKRYTAISRAMMSESFGILVSTKPGQNRMSVARKLQRMAMSRGFSAEIIVSDEIAPALIENFRFDCYINTACPRIAYDDQSRFTKPVITPQEFEIAIGVREDYTLDFL